MTYGRSYPNRRARLALAAVNESLERVLGMEEATVMGTLTCSRVSTARWRHRTADNVRFPFSKKVKWRLDLLWRIYSSLSIRGEVMGD